MTAHHFRNPAGDTLEIIRRINDSGVCQVRIDWTIGKPYPLIGDAFVVYSDDDVSRILAWVQNISLGGTKNTYQITLDLWIGKRTVSR